ncbi:cytochrome P450 [Dendrothele bispora CBS 962.96]|uniref:Cytochrome P450 n=1 Tax=Dendrothele bispora (strain CBS 962.96) TaxID=1314807 RepID=A0A4S8L3G9_DENBC|nr:cytochrome P450 [Dendrothele bispora CBS 962.96]
MFPIRIDIVVAVVVVLVCRVLYKRSRPSLRNLRGPPAENFIFGNLRQLMSDDGYNFHAHLAQNYGGVVKLHSLLGAKDLYVFDHTAMESVLIKEEPIFNMPDALLAANHLIFGPCLVSTSGESMLVCIQHRRARKILNPVFSLTQLKAIAPIICEIAQQTSDALAANIGPGSEIDMLKVVGSAALEYIGQGGLGHSFAAHKSDALRDMKELLLAAKRLIVPIQALPFLMKVLPAGLRRSLIDYVPLPDLHLVRDLVDALDNTSRSILSRKKQALKEKDSVLAEQVGQGKDITTVLMKSVASDQAENRMSDEEILGQMNVLLFAGIDTTGTAMSRCLQELTLHPDIQDKLRSEVTSAIRHGGLDYETLNSLPLLEAVCRETLRMYPPAITSSRQALADTVLPLSKPIVGIDNKEITEVFVPAGTLIHIGIKAANQDRSVWGPDATEWKPERWLSLPETVINAKVPGVYPKLMTFIGGPRGCIGFKFAEMAMKTTIAVLVKNFVFSSSETEIVWKLGVAEAPTVDGKHTLPMIVTPVAID